MEGRGEEERGEEERGEEGRARMNAIISFKPTLVTKKCTSTH